MHTKLKYLALLCAVVFTESIAGQTPQNVEMADAMRANGKIYVVVVIAAIVFAGILAYLIYIDRKLKKLEKQIEQ